MAILLHTVQQIDLWILHAFNVLSGNWVVDNAMDFISSNNLLKGALPVAAYWYLWFNRTASQPRNRVILVQGILAAFVAVILARGLTHLLPVRMRPFVDPASGSISFFEPNPKNFEDWSAFPSDTAAFTFALSCTLMYISRRLGICLLLLSAIPACITRIYIGVHYPSDIVVGAMIGILAVWMMHKITISRLARSAVVQGTGNHPWFYCIAFVLTFEVAKVFSAIREARSFGIKLLHHLDPHSPDGASILSALSPILV